ncbi:hypothetical protein TBR22_A30270 [Luteitalea sp. TBR-22]|uniref:DUF3617 domain-containing protein n=1 Tax=Luteitalea sp. TBR-22 TaxID=2802971 RepID=UPI001AF2D1F6|nr:DUF3617 family protein [Luteitalea sp. TBR-22]BCS33799.1 hypothetical protein TBR22_A30270 [Luteitalea sp. TBR-22]
MLTSAYRKSGARASLATVCVAGFSLVGLAADWPAFTPGRWQIDRTMETGGRTPEKVSRTECLDPTAEHRSQREILTRAGCQFSPVSQSGTTYRFTATCKMAGTTSTSTSVLEVRSAEAYTIIIDSVTNGAKSHEVLTARRLGACAK